MAYVIIIIVINDKKIIMKGDEKVTIYLNTINPLENYRELLNEEYFVDKSSIIEIN